MSRKKRVSVNPDEAVVPIGTTLPASIVDHLTARARKTFSDRSTYVRNAILAKMKADGELADDFESDEASA